MDQDSGNGTSLADVGPANLIKAGFRTPLGSFCAQVILTQVLVLTIQRVSNGRDQIFEEFLCTFQTAVLTQELSIIRTAYGTAMYALGMFCLGVLFLLTFRNEIHSNPVQLIHMFSAHGRMADIAELLVRISEQTFAVIVAGKYVSFLWTMRFFNSGLALIHMDNPCRSEIQVPLLVGVIVEGVATFVLRMVHHSSRGGIVDAMFCSLTAVICNLCARPYTGGYINPSVAFTEQFACRGQSRWEFIVVYVGGPIIAAYFVGQYGDSIWRFLRPGIQLPDNRRGSAVSRHSRGGQLSPREPHLDHHSAASTHGSEHRHGSIASHAHAHSIH